MSLNKALRYPGRWNAPTTEYPMGVPKNRTSDTAKDGTYFEKDWLAEHEAFFGALMNEAGFSPNGDVDTAEASQFFDSLVNLKQVAPLNNDYNGYMDPDHQSSLPSDAGYPGASGSPTTYGLDNEISYRIYSGIVGNSVSSDADGWIFSGSIYKEYVMTAEQIALIDVNYVNVFVKDEDGVSYFWKNGDTGVTVSKPTSTALRVTLSSAIFGVITKLWRFFVTEKVGYVGELSAGDVEREVRGGYLFIENANGTAKLWSDGSVELSGKVVASGAGSFTATLPVQVGGDVRFAATMVKVSTTDANGLYLSNVTTSSVTFNVSTDCVVDYIAHGRYL